jgi:hypothetical protein
MDRLRPAFRCLYDQLYRPADGLRSEASPGKRPENVGERLRALAQ